MIKDLNRINIDTIFLFLTLSAFSDKIVMSSFFSAAFADTGSANGSIVADN